jgi:hypothetical protein
MPQPTPWLASEPSEEFKALLALGLDLEEVKKRYVRAMFYQTRSVIQTAALLKVDRATVMRHLLRRAL